MSTNHKAKDRLTFTKTDGYFLVIEFPSIALARSGNISEDSDDTEIKIPNLPSIFLNIKQSRYPYVIIMP